MRRVAVSACVLFFICIVPALAHDSAGNIGGYSHNLWQTDDGLPSNSIQAVTQTRDGYLWLGTKAGLVRFDGVRFAVFDKLNTKEILSNDILDLYEDRDGNLWVGTTGGGLNRLRDGKFTSYTTRDGLSQDFVRSIYEDGDGSLWIANYGGGVNRFKDGRFTAYTTNVGLFDNTIYQVLDDDQGNLWMSCNRGIFFVSKQQLNDFAENRIASVTSVPFGKSDGMRSSECNGGNQPAGIKARDGNLWFPTIEGVAVVDPRRMLINTQPPPVLIDKTMVDDHVLVDGLTEATLPPGKGQLEFHYTALSFLAPEKVMFKYKLEGFDQDWTDAGARRVAYYTNLPPGSYRFRVIACNNDGKWNEEGAIFAFTLAPHFYETGFFYALSTLFFSCCCGDM